MKLIHATLLAAFTCLAAPAALAARPPVELQFARGQSGTVVRGVVRGQEFIDYNLRARAGQEIAIRLDSRSSAVYFNLQKRGNSQAMFVGSMSGNRFEGVLPDSGSYTIRVYLIRAAARRNERAEYSLDVSIRPQQPGAGAPGGFESNLALQGVRFAVSFRNGRLRVVPSGLAADNSPIVRDLGGSITQAEVADLNNDGSPELYLLGRDASGHGRAIVYSANRRRSLSEAYVAPVDPASRVGAGYRGQGDFAVVENRLVHRFPVFRPGDRNTPTGGTRQIQYRLTQGESGWVFTRDRVSNY